MSTVVCFRSRDGEYAIPVEHVREVRSGGQLLPLPTPREGVAGLLPYGDGAVTVMSVFGEYGGHVLLLDGTTRNFGLAVDEVTRVVELVGEVSPPPAGQEGRWISGIVGTPGGITLLVDVNTLDEALGE